MALRARMSSPAYVMEDPGARFRAIGQLSKTTPLDANWVDSMAVMLGEISEPVLLADPVHDGCPMVWMSQGFCTLTGYGVSEMIGKSWDALLDGVPESYVSRSAQQNVQDYLAACQMTGLYRIGEIYSVQPNRRKDGSLFSNLLLLGHCQFRGHPCIIGVPVCLGEGALFKATRVQLAQALDNARLIFRHVRGLVLTQTGSHLFDDKSSWTRSFSPIRDEEKVPRPEFCFFVQRLQEHCVIVDSGFAAIRRESEKVARGCMLFSDRPVRRRPGRGILFDVRIDCVARAFSGLPVLGFTRMRPKDFSDLYPSVSKCLGASALIGGTGTASERDQEQHFKIGFQTPPANEISEGPALISEMEAAASTMFNSQGSVKMERLTTPAGLALRNGDVLRCAYTESGRLELSKNGNVPFMAWETGRPLKPGAEYYAVVDVCLGASAVTLVAPDEAPDALFTWPEELNSDSDSDSSAWCAEGL